MKKESIGLIIILGGIAVLGFIWFKKNKPQLSDKQLQDLKTKSNNLKWGVNDPNFDYTQDTLVKSGNNPYTASTFTMGELTPKQQQDIKSSIGVVYDPIASVSNQISKNLENADFSALNNLNFDKIDWSNIKIK